MDGIANVAKQQQTQITPHELQTKVSDQMQTAQAVTQTKMQEEDTLVKTQDTSTSSKNKLDSQKDVESLVKKLNEAMTPLNPDIKFGVDKNNIFYVAAIDAKTDRIIRRFPAEQANDFLPKMQEVTGILFDSKG